MSVADLDPGGYQRPENDDQPHPFFNWFVFYFLQVMNELPIPVNTCA